MKLNIFCKHILFLCLIPLAGFCQEKDIIMPLDTGQKMPDVVLNNVFNYSKDSIKLSDLRGKLVIIDFWGTGCSGCIESFPDMEQLQRDFGDSIQIVMVNNQSEDSTKRFFRLHPKIKIPNLPFATGDTILSRYFPHYTVPEHVWIDKDGIIRAITYSKNSTVQNIQEVLNGERISLHIKRDVYSFNREVPIIAQNTEPYLSKMKYSSSLLSAIDGIGGSTSLRENGSDYPYHIQYNDLSARLLFVNAFQENGKYNFWGAKNSVILEVKDKLRFEVPTDPQQYNYWQTHYSYCYDLWVPPDQATRIYDIMKRDLENYFNAYGKIEKRKVECLVLVRTTKKDLLYSKGGKSEFIANKAPYNSEIYYRNWDFNDIVSTIHMILDQLQLSTPFINATGYKGKVDMIIPYDNGFIKYNLQQLRNSLQKYGLDLKKEKRKTNVLVIRDLNQK